MTSRCDTASRSAIPLLVNPASLRRLKAATPSSRIEATSCSNALRSRPAPRIEALLQLQPVLVTPNGDGGYRIGRR